MQKKEKSAKNENKVLTKKEKANKKRAEGLKRFFKETKAEFKKIVWPTPKQTLKSTAVVILMILAVGIVIWCVDALSTAGINAILNNY